MALMSYDHYLIYLQDYETRHWYGRGFRRSLTMQPVTEAMKMPAGPGRNFAVLTAIAKVRVASPTKQDQYGEFLNKLEQQIQTSGRRNIDTGDAALNGYVGGGVTVTRNHLNNEPRFEMTRLRANSFRNALSSTPLMAKMWSLRYRLPLVSYVGITHLTTMKCYMAPAYCRKPPRNSPAAANYVGNYHPQNNDGVMNIIYPRESMNMNPEITIGKIKSIDSDIPIYDFPANPFNPLANDPDWMGKISRLIDGQAHGNLCTLAGCNIQECLGWALKFEGSFTKVQMRFASGRNNGKFNTTIESLSDHPGRDMNMTYAFSLADWVRRCLGGSNMDLKTIKSPRTGQNTWTATFSVAP